MLRNTYSHLNNVQKGSFGEAFAKMAFTLEGFEVYAADYDDRGIDFVARATGGSFLSVQVKATDQSSNPCIYADKFHASSDFVFCAVRLTDGNAPTLYLARGCDWNSGHNCLHHNPGGGKSGAYFEMRFAAKYEAEIANFAFTNFIDQLRA